MMKRQIEFTLSLAAAVVLAAPVAVAGPTGSGVVLADLDGDGDTDFVFRSSDTVGFWITDWNGTVPVIQSGSGFPLAANNQIRAVAKFNDDNIDDFVVFDTNTFDVVIWTMGIDSGTGNVIITGASLVGNSGSATNMPVGVGQFNPETDSIPDIVFQDAAPLGNISAWFIDSSLAFAGGGFIGAAGDFEYVSSADVNGDGVSDLVKRNVGLSQVSFWELDNGLASGVVRGSGFEGVGSNLRLLRQGGDIDQDGIDDIMLQDSNNGAIFSWLLIGDALTAPTIKASPAAGFTVDDLLIGLGQFDKDPGGFPDVILQRADTSTSVWVLNAGTFSGGGFVGTTGTGFVVVNSGEEVLD